MNREEFLRQLELLLSGISEEERADAMAFYRSYFEDAGEGNEVAIIAELESPQKVAESIKKNLGIDGSGGYYNTFANRDAAYYKNVSETERNLAKENGKSDNTTMTTAGVVILVLTSPFWLTLLAVAAAVIFAVAVISFSVAISVAAVMAALLISGFAILGVGFGMLFTGAPVVGLGLIGGGLIVFAIGMLMILLVVWLFGVFLPWVVKGLWNLCKKPFNRGKGRVSE